ncbi:Insect cuticle protein [Trinorchestia longiramus]|nr:Insect cuticle protein [Trinorchestia longiramus]
MGSGLGLELLSGGCGEWSQPEREWKIYLLVSVLEAAAVEECGCCGAEQVFLVLLGAVALATAAPFSISNVQENFSHVQEVDDDGEEITGTYRWTDAEGNNFFVTYIADDDGFRVLDSNAVPVNSDGVRADGTQGSFSSDEDDDDFDDRK